MHRLLTRVLVVLLVVAAAQLAPAPVAWSAPATRSALLRATGTAQGLEFPASHFGVRWQGDEHALVELRWRDDDGWTDWQSVTVDHDLSDSEGSQHVYSGLLIAERGTQVQSRVVSGDARDLEVFAVDTRYGPRRLVSALRGGSAAQASFTDTRVGKPSIVTRAQWGADESMRRGTPSFAPVKKLIVHHTATPNAEPDPAARVRAIYAHHVQFRGWNDIGYNFLVDQQGRIYEGRYARQYAAGETPTGEDTQGRGVIGAHAEGANTGSVGVSLLGDFTDQLPTSAAMGALEAMLAWKADRHSIDVMAADTYPNLAGHKDTKATSCPGTVLYDHLPEVRRRVAAAVQSAHGLTKGYWVTADNGGVLTFGEARSFGSMAGQRMNAPVIGMAQTASGGGYWLLGADGGIFSFGDARFHGSTGGMRLNKPVVGMAATPTGNGYWLVASDGGIFAYGDAAFRGSMGGKPLNKPVVGMAPTRSGQGYWLVASDGGIFAFGDAGFHGSTGSMRLNSPIVGMAAASDGRGYWLLGADGGIFAFDVPFHGSIPGLRLAHYGGSAAMRATSTVRGYYILGRDGGVYTFGDARFHGARATAPAAARDIALLDPKPS